MIVRIIDKVWRTYLAYTNPKKLASILYKRILNQEPDFDNPKTLNEKINWLKFNSDTSLWTNLADKYLVREYVQNKGVGDSLVDIYGMWTNVDDIKFEELPESFVFKSNNACKTVLFIENKNEIDEKQIRKTLKKWLRIQFGYETAEPHYLNIQPCIIAEEYLKETNPISTTLIDYKFHCFNGEPIYAQVMCNRDKVDYNFSIYDTNWGSHPEWMQKDLRANSLDVPEPVSLKEMLNICRVLSKGIPQVRVDFYEVGGKVYFGELTFTPCGGYDYDITPEFDLLLGSKLKLH